MVRGVNEYSFYPEVVGLFDGFPEANGEGCVIFDCSFAKYQLTFSGPVTVENVAAIPLPASLVLLIGGLSGLALIRCQKVL